MAESAPSPERAVACDTRTRAGVAIAEGDRRSLLESPSYSSAPPARPNRDALCGECTSDGLLADPEPQTDLHQGQSIDVQLDRLGEVALIETAVADRDRPAEKVRRHRAPMNVESLGQLHVRRPSLVEDHQFVRLRRGQEGLSHPNRTHHPAPRVRHRRRRRSAILLVDPPRPARSNGFQGRAGVLKLSTEVHTTGNVRTLPLVITGQGSFVVCPRSTVISRMIAAARGLLKAFSPQGAKVQRVTHREALGAHDTDRRRSSDHICPQGGALL